MLAYFTSVSAKTFELFLQGLIRTHDGALRTTITTTGLTTEIHKMLISFQKDMEDSPHTHLVSSQ